MSHEIYLFLDKKEANEKRNSFVHSIFTADKNMLHNKSDRGMRRAHETYLLLYNMGRRVTSARAVHAHNTFVCLDGERPARRHLVQSVKGAKAEKFQSKDNGRRGRLEFRRV